MRAPGLPAALSVELLKAHRSRIPLSTFSVITVGPLAGALFIFIGSDPQRARDLGLVGAKAQLSGITADWPGLMAFGTQVAAVVSVLLYAFILTWLFGREFVDRTAHQLMALPVSRTAIVTAKLGLYAAWGVLLWAWLAVATLLVGAAMNLPGWSASVVGDGISAMLRAGLLSLVAATPIAYVASRARGYLAPLATTMGLIVLAQLAVALGWGAVLPWSIPALAAGVVPDQHAGIGSVLIVGFTGAAGCWATNRWWHGPDAAL